MPKQSRSHHDDVRSRQDQLGRLFGSVDAGGGGQGTVDPSVQYRDPPQHEAELGRRGQDQVGDDLQTVKVDVGLVETVEQHQAIGPGRYEALGHVRPSMRRTAPP